MAVRALSAVARAVATPSPSIFVPTRSVVVFKYSDFAEDHVDRTEYEAFKNPPEWKYVENLFFSKTVPKPEPKAEYPSGWRPRRPADADRAYRVARTGNHMLPLYLAASHRGARKITKIAKVDGDIFAMNEEVRSYLKSKRGRAIATRVHEACGKIEVKGDHFLDVRDFLYSKGF